MFCLKRIDNTALFVYYIQYIVIAPYLENMKANGITGVLFHIKSRFKYEQRLVE